MTWDVSVQGIVHPQPLLISTTDGGDVEFPLFAIPYYGMEDTAADTLEDAISVSAQIMEIEPGESLAGTISLVDGRAKRIVMSNSCMTATITRVAD